MIGEAGLGLNVAGEGVICGAEYVADREAFIWKTKVKYERTPVTESDAVPRGKYMHIGEGVWLKRCRECDDFLLTYGTYMYDRTFAEHERAHGLDVVGFNLPMLVR